MKLNFRDLKQQKFTIDAEPSDTVAQVKEKIAAEKGWDASSQKLIYSGKILADTNTVESYKIEEKGFIVCMVSKPKAAPAAKAAPAPAAPPATPAVSASTPAPPPAPQQSSAAPVASTNVPSTPTPAQAVPPAPGSAGFGDESAMLVGNRSESAIQEMEAMGFVRADIDAAMRAAFFNPDRAIDYLLNGIPENVRAEPRPTQAQQPEPQATQPQQGATTQPAAPQEQPTEGEVDLFAAAAAAAQGQGGQQGGRARGQGMGAGAPTGAAPSNPQSGQLSMDFLRTSPHFQQIRQLVQQQPAMLEPILQQVAEGNPQLAQLIGQNQHQFLQLLSENQGDEEGGGLPGPQAIHITQDENDAIERLCLLGFARERVIQAYFACDKNEELAANFLFEQPDDED